MLQELAPQKISGSKLCSHNSFSLVFHSGSAQGAVLCYMIRCLMIH